MAYQMDYKELTKMAEAWLEAEAEKQAIIQRMCEVEGRLVELAKDVASLPDSFEGSHAVVVGPYEIRLTRQVEKEVDVPRLLQIASQNDLFKYLSGLFEWEFIVKEKGWVEENKDIAWALDSDTMSKFEFSTFEIIKKQEVCHVA